MEKQRDIVNTAFDLTEVKSTGGVTGGVEALWIGSKSALTAWAAPEEIRNAAETVEVNT